MKSCRFLCGIVYLMLCGVAAAFCCGAAFGQATTASLTGVVEDPSKAVVPKVSVTAINTDTGSKTRTFTNKEGIYVFPSLQTGNYRIEVDKQGFKGIIEAGLTLHVQDVLQLNFHMAVGSMSETVTVNASQLETTTGTVSTVIDKTLIENMPLNGKDLTTLFELSPGTLLNAGGSPEYGGGFSVDGQRPTANYLTIDGASGNTYVPIVTGSGVSSNVTGASIATSASGGTNGILPIDAIEEYRMDTSAYTAENGRTPGGQIQVRTRSGTNQFHGTLFENLRNQAFNADDWFTKYLGQKQTPLRMNDFGGTLGGPVIIPRLFDGKNKLFFFIANDTLLLNQPGATQKQDVPNSSVVQQAYSTFKNFMGVFPAGNTMLSPGSCSASDPYCDPSNPGFDVFDSQYSYLVRNHTTSVRLDAQLPRSIHAFFRANIAPSSSFLPSIQSQGSDVNIKTYTGGLTIPLTSHLVDELTINQTSDDTEAANRVGSIGGNNPNAISDNLPDGVNLSTDVFEYGTGTRKLTAAFDGPSNLNSLHQWNVVDTISFQVGPHSLKFGGDVLTHNSQIHAYSNNYGVFVLLPSSPPYTNLDNGIVSEIEYAHNNAQPNIETRDTSLYVNDDWRVLHSLRLNLGLRWEYNPSPTVSPLGTLAVEGTNLNPGSVQAYLSTNSLYRTRYDNFAPRFGFAWSPESTWFKHTVLRGGVGIYFDTAQAATVAQATTGGYPYQSSAIVTNVPYSSVNFAGLASGAAAATLPNYNIDLVDPGLISPRTYEWSLTIEHALGKNTRLSTSYVGNDGEKLIGYEETYNSPNSNGQYPVNTSLVDQYGSLYILTNQSHSNYQALQMQLTSRLGSRLSVLASYTWGHAEDNGSTDFSSVGAAEPNRIANSSNDIRHIFAAAIHFAPKAASSHPFVRVLSEGWAFDSITRLQTASPLTVVVAAPFTDSFAGNADVVPGVPAVLHEHLDSYGNVVPGNKLLNWAAFTSPPTDSNGNLLRQGNSPTNGYRLFGLSQWDLALSRTWKVWRDLNLDFRVDAYNVLNAVNFASVNSDWYSTDASTFGRATSTYASANGEGASAFGASGSQLTVFQNGGPRELQLSLKLKF